MPSRRIAKVNRAILETLSSAILFELRDPRVKNVTILHVDTTEDLKECKVRVGVRGDAKVQSLTLHGLDSSRGFLQSKIADRLETRYTPVLKFVLEPNWLDHLTATSQSFLEANETAIPIVENSQENSSETEEEEGVDDDDADEDHTEVLPDEADEDRLAE